MAYVKKCSRGGNIPAAGVGRRDFLALVGGSAIGLLARRLAAAEGNRGRRKPNIIFILADDLGYGDLGCYGQKKIKTPNIDRMAADGMRFTQCYAGSTVCAPSRCCLMTGLHTGHARIRSNGAGPLLPEDVTVAELLKQAGYATGVIGKWGLGREGSTGTPTKQGFDYWFGYLSQVRAHNYYPDYVWKNEEKHVLEENQGEKKGNYSHDLFTAEAMDFITRNKSQPFFLYLAYTIPHANNELTRVTGNGMEVPSDAPYSEESWPQQQKNHAAMITRMDGDIGKIVALLKELGIDDDTVIFFSSDNGPHREGGARPEFFRSAGPLRGIKRDLYEGGIRVPMIVRWPGRIKAGTVSDQVWAFWDFLPTATELAGVKPPKRIDGISIVPTLLGENVVGRQQERHEFLYWELRGQQAVRMGHWKAVRRKAGAPLELYDLSKDTAEQRNIAAHHPEIVARIEEYLKTCRTEPRQEVEPKKPKGQRYR